MVHRLRIGFVAAALAIAMCVPGYASNLVINPTFDSTITSDPDAVAIEASINAAINFYETYFTDPIAVSITFQEMTSGLGRNPYVGFGVAARFGGLRGLGYGRRPIAVECERFR